MDIRKELDALHYKLLTLLREEVGLFSNGQPAIWRGTQIPVGLKTTGLQITIQPSKTGDALQVSGGTFEDQSWIVELVNFANDDKLVIAQRKIERGFTTSRSTVYKPATDLGLEQARCFIYAPRLVSGDAAPRLVESINGKTGVVRLSPADIGAEPAGIARSLLVAHEDKDNPHPQYLTSDALGDRLSGYEEKGAIALALGQHNEETNPHPQYLTRDEFTVELGEAIASVSPQSQDASLAAHLGNPNAHPQYVAGAQFLAATATLSDRIDNKLDFDSDLATISQLSPATGDLLVFGGGWNARRLTAADIPDLPASKLTTGVLPIASIPAVVARTFTHTQAIASNSWYIAHNLGRFPSVVVVDGSGVMVVATITHHSANELSISFGRSETGTAHLS